MPFEEVKAHVLQSCGPVVMIVFRESQSIEALSVGVGRKGGHTTKPTIPLRSINAESMTTS
jgi:hypothetical protein